MPLYFFRTFLFSCADPVVGYKLFALYEKKKKPKIWNGKTE